MVTRSIAEVSFQRHPEAARATNTQQTCEATGVSRQPVLDCGTIFHPDCGSRDFPSILSDDLRKHISLATEAPSDSFDYRRYINNCIYLSSCTISSSASRCSDMIDAAIGYCC